MYGLTQLTPPTREPLRLSEVRKHLGLADGSHDVELTEQVLPAARRQAELATRRQIMTATWTWAVDCFPNSRLLKVPLPPLQSVTEIRYKDSDDAPATVDSGDYYAITIKEPGEIVLKPGKSWPTTNGEPIEIEFAAGYGSEPTKVPQLIRQGILLLCGHYFEQREEVITGTIATAIPSGAAAIFQIMEVGDEFASYNPVAA